MCGHKGVSKSSLKQIFPCILRFAWVGYVLKKPLMYSKKGLVGGLHNSVESDPDVLSQHCCHIVSCQSEIFASNLGYWAPSLKSAPSRKAVVLGAGITRFCNGDKSSHITPW